MPNAKILRFLKAPPEKVLKKERNNFKENKKTTNKVAKIPGI